MAEVTFFHFQKGNTLMHRIDTKIKLFLLLIYSFSIYQLDSAGVIFLSIFILVTFRQTLTGSAGLIREMKGIFFILILIITGPLISIPGEPLFRGIPFISREGLGRGLFSGWRFLLIVMLGLIFTASTRQEQIHSAVSVILKPVPFINEANIAARISLTIMFIPILLDMLNEVREARKARYIEGSRNPIKNITSIAVPLIAGVVRRAEETSMAMESRLYSGEIIIEKEGINRGDYLQFLFSLIPVTLAFSLQIINQNF